MGDQAGAYRAALATALRAGWAVLAAGGAAVDAAIAAVCALEDNELFNAGRGAVFTSAGAQEMDAAVMDGATRQVGAVAGIVGPRNPVRAAHAVMRHSGHALLAGDGALAFCRAQGLAFEPPSYFHTDRRWQALQSVLAPGHRALSDADRHGTVGAVACDGAGRLAAATSTGGMTAKHPGRVGDSPLPGAGTWADQTCAVSATGHGESFIRAAAGHEISARMRLAGETLDQAAAAVLADVAALGGSGGLVAVGAAGQVAMPFDTQGMYRGQIGPDGAPRVAIYAEALAEF